MERGDPNADKRGIAGLSRGDNSTVNWREMEIVDFAQSSSAPVAVQRIEKVFGGDQPKGPDRQFALHGSRRNYIAYCFPGSAAARGVRFNSVGTIHAPYHQSDGRLGDKLQTALVRQKGGYGSCRETVSAFMLRNSGLLSLWHMRIAPGVHAATPYIFARAGRALLFPNMSREYAFTAQNAGKACKRKIALIRLEPEAVCSFRRRIRQAAKFSRQPDLRPAVACIHVRFSCLADVPIALAACPNAFQEESVRRVFTAAAARKR